MLNFLADSQTDILAETGGIPAVTLSGGGRVGGGFEHVHIQPQSPQNHV